MAKPKINFLFNHSITHEHHLIVPTVEGKFFGWCLIEPENCDAWSDCKQFETIGQAIAAGKSNLTQYLAELE